MDVMGKITFQRNQTSTTLRLEGKLTGLWVDEVARAWCDVVSTLPTKSVTVDLAGVTFIDSEGIKLIRWLFEQGSRLRASHLMTQFIIERVAQDARKSRSTKPSVTPKAVRDSAEQSQHLV
jgi:ABC-type transporter Mla MlaB component